MEPENGFTSLSDTAPIDSSIGRDVVVEFTVGSGQVILGLDVAIQSMAVGGVYELTIPTCYAYGESGFPPSIPPNAVLVYIVELLSIVEKKMFTDGLVVPGHKM